MKSRIALAVLALGLAGCHKAADEAPPAATAAGSGHGSGRPAPMFMPSHPHPARPPTGTPRPQDKLTVTVDGKPVAMATALAWRTWDGTIRMTVSSVPVGCDEVTGEMRRLHDGEVTFDVDVAQALQPDGSTKLQLRSTNFGAETRSETAALTGSGDGTPGQSTTAMVDFTLADTHSPPRTLVAKGTIDALGCVPVAPPKVDPPPPPMAATLEIAGQKLPIRGAFITQLGDWPELRLTTGSEGCTQVAYAPPSPLELTLTWMKPGRDVGQASVGGSLIGDLGGDQTFDKKQLVITPSPPVAGQLHLAGNVKIHGYPVKLDGTVTAVACPK